MEVGKRAILVYQTWKLRVALVLLALVGGIGGWQLYALGQANAEAELVALRLERDQLAARLATQTADYREVQRRLAMLERSSQVDAEAYAGIRAERTALDNEIHQLREELNFYRGIMSPSTAKVGLQAQDFVVEPVAGSPDQVQIRLMLVQIKNNQQLARGNLEMTLSGEQDGQPRQYRMEQLSIAKLSGIKYRFRYFQPVEDIWLLPQGFHPRQLNVKAVAANAKQPALEWTFSWPDNGADAGEVMQDVGTQTD